MNEKKLFVIRHGKSSWEIDYMEDIDRPLTDRGVRNAYTMGKRLADRQLVPEWIYSSPANRALHTAIIMARVLAIPEESIFIRRNLYMGSRKEIISVIENTPDHISSIAIFGHNPSFTVFVNGFLNEKLDNLPTAGLVILTFDADSWKDFTRGNLVSEYVDFPRKK